MEDWGYLDKPNFNLLYGYCEALTGEKSRIESVIMEERNKRNKKDEDTLSIDELETDIYIRQENSKKNAFYLIWFVYHYVLKCETYEQALKYADIDTIKKYSLHKFFWRKCLYIGVGEYRHIFDCNLREGDIEAVLDILYHRLVGIKQFECVLKHLPKGSVRYKRCLATYELLSAEKYLYEGKVL